MLNVVEDGLTERKAMERWPGLRRNLDQSPILSLLCCLRFLRVQQSFVFFVSLFFCHQSFCHFSVVVNATQFRVTAPVLTECVKTETGNGRMSRTTSHSLPEREYPVMMLQCPFWGDFRRVFDFGMNPFDDRRVAVYIDRYHEPERANTGGA